MKIGPLAWVKRPLPWLVTMLAWSLLLGTVAHAATDNPTCAVEARTLQTEIDAAKQTGFVAARRVAEKRKQHEARCGALGSARAPQEPDFVPVYGARVDCDQLEKDWLAETQRAPAPRLGSNAATRRFREECSTEAHAAQARRDHDSDASGPKGFTRVRTQGTYGDWLEPLDDQGCLGNNAERDRCAEKIIKQALAEGRLAQAEVDACRNPPVATWRNAHTAEIQQRRMATLPSAIRDHERGYCTHKVIERALEEQQITRAAYNRCRSAQQTGGEAVSLCLEAHAIRDRVSTSRIVSRKPTAAAPRIDLHSFKKPALLQAIHQRDWASAPFAERDYGVTLFVRLGYAEVMPRLLEHLRQAPSDNIKRLLFGQGSMHDLGQAGIDLTRTFGGLENCERLAAFSHEREQCARDREARRNTPASPDGEHDASRWLAQHACTSPATTHFGQRLVDWLFLDEVARGSMSWAAKHPRLLDSPPAHTPAAIEPRGVKSN